MTPKSEQANKLMKEYTEKLRSGNNILLTMIRGGEPPAEAIAVGAMPLPGYEKESTEYFLDQWRNHRPAYFELAASASTLVDSKTEPALARIELKMRLNEFESELQRRELICEGISRKHGLEFWPFLPGPSGSTGGLNFAGSATVRKVGAE